MSLAALGRTDSRVVAKGVDFLRRTVRADGSWPVDSNLAVWLTTMSVEALSPGGNYEGPRAEDLRAWLLEARQSAPHPYTGAAPGGWPWTDLPGGVPDADDTSGALIALARLGQPADSAAVREGLRWLCGLQNRDGGWPTFCRGWGKLPFDRSTADIAAHALRAFAAWQPRALETSRPVRRGLDYLARVQREDGAWAPLWFGSQATPDGADLVYGTARVLPAYHELGLGRSPEAARAARFLLDAQNPEGGWGGGPGAHPTVEDTALALAALHASAGPDAAAAVTRGAAWLAEQVEAGALNRPAPIGLYFARLWYSEALYPVVWTAAALGRLLRGT
jgi:squalene-hopene/tetraprenyl-beta-curcumene cyclase